jgi:hypothetical protein
MCFYPHVSPNNKIRWVLSLAYTTNHATTLCANILLSKFSVLHSQLCSWQLKESKGVFGWWVDENGTVLFLFFGCLVSYGGRVKRLLESLRSGIAQKSGWARSPKSSTSAPVLPSLAKSNPSSVSTSLCSSISSPPWGAPPLWAPTSAPTFYRCREELFLCEHLPLLLHLAGVVRSFAVINLGESLPPLLLPSPDLFLPLPSTLHPHYRNRVLCRVSKTLGKGYFTLGKGFAECNTRQIFHRQMVLCRVLFSDTRQRKTLGKLRIEKLKKTAKHFLNTRNNSPTLPYYLTRCPIIFHYYFESNLYVL